MLLACSLTAALGVPAAGLGRLARRYRPDRTWLLALAAATVAELVAGCLHLLAVGTGWRWAGTASDFAFLAAPPLLVVAVVVALLRRLDGVRRARVVDAAAAALAGGSVAALAVAPAVLEQWDGTWGTAVLLGRPLLDLVTVMTAAAAVGLLGASRSRQHAVWTLAALLLAGASVLRLSGVALLDPPAGPVALTLTGFALLLVGAVVPAGAEASRVNGPRSVTVPALAALAAVAVLTVAPPWPAGPVPTALALAALACSGARFVRVFQQLHVLVEVRQQALTDELTGLPNRRALYLHLDTLLDGDPAARAEAEAAGLEIAELEGEVTVGLVDLDHFKEVNDTLGHAAGDAMLREVSSRMTRALDELEVPYLFARLGGDEFALVVHHAESPDAAAIVGEALTESLAAPMDLEGEAVHAQASIGLALAPSQGRTRSEALCAADAAMYAAKTSGQRVRLYSPDRHEADPQLALAEELHRALENGEIVVDYLPVCTVGGSVVAAEALVRWEHPERGRMLPAAFLEAAERYRLSAALTRRVLDLALGDLARWRAHGFPIRVTVNVSGADLRDDEIATAVAQALLQHRLPADALTLDVREADLAQLDRQDAADVLRVLDDLGVGLALDDYGVGGLGIATLRDLPFDEVKLDRRFVRDVAVSDAGSAVVRASLGLVHALGMQLVAEGVEDSRALARLADLGCDLVQGHHVGRPGPASALESRLAAARPGRHAGMAEQSSSPARERLTP